MKELLIMPMNEIPIYQKAIISIEIALVIYFIFFMYLIIKQIKEERKNK